MPLLHQACPSFAKAWEEHRASEGNEEPLLYVDFGAFARHVIKLQQQGEAQEFPAVFNVIERLHLEGDPYVMEAATIGLLEGIQNIAGHEGMNPEVFVPYLGPQTKRWWDKLNDFWSGKSSTNR